MIGLRMARPGDLETIGARAAEPAVRAYVEGGHDLSPVIANPWTRVMTIDDAPVAAGGFVDVGGGAALGWALVGSIPKTQFVSLCRVYRGVMLATPFRWIEAHCVEGFTQSFRWVRLLGFLPVEGAKIFAADGREFRRFVFKR